MSKVWKVFKNYMLQPDQIAKLFKNQSPGQRILPANTNTNNSQLQLRIDAGEVKDGKKHVYLQVNSEAKNTALKKFKSKHGTHANIAQAELDMEVEPEEQADEVKKLVGKLEEEYTSKIG